MQERKEFTKGANAVGRRSQRLKLMEHRLATTKQKNDYVPI